MSSKKYGWADYPIKNEAKNDNPLRDSSLNVRPQAKIERILPPVYREASFKNNAYKGNEIVSKVQDDKV